MKKTISGNLLKTAIALSVLAEGVVKNCEQFNLKSSLNLSRRHLIYFYPGHHLF